MVCAEMATRPTRSPPSMAAIGASSVGSRADRKARIGAAEAVDPGDFRKQPDDAMERQDDADEENAEDQAVEPGIGHEGVEDLALQHERDQRRTGSGTPASAPERCGASRAWLVRVVLAIGFSLARRIRAQYGIAVR